MRLSHQPRSSRMRCWTVCCSCCCSFFFSSGVAAVLMDGDFVDRRRRSLVRVFVVVGLVAMVYAGGSLVMFRGVDGRASGLASLGSTALVVFFACVSGLVILESKSPLLSVLRARPVVYLGQISYGLYLYHPIVLHAAETLSNRMRIGHPWWLVAGMIACAVAVASASWILVEKPILALKDRIPYTSRPPRKDLTPAL